MYRDQHSIADSKNVCSRPLNAQTWPLQGSCGWDGDGLHLQADHKRNLRNPVSPTNRDAAFKAVGGAPVSADPLRKLFSIIEANRSRSGGEAMKRGAVAVLFHPPLPPSDLNTSFFSISFDAYVQYLIIVEHSESLLT